MSLSLPVIQILLQHIQIRNQNALFAGQDVRRIQFVKAKALSSAGHGPVPENLQVGKRQVIEHVPARKMNQKKSHAALFLKVIHKSHLMRVNILQRKGIHLSKTTVHKYMNKDLSLHAIVMRKKTKYRREVKNKIFSNLLKQDFRSEGKNRIWCTDFTYIRLSNGKMRYNCSILDLYDRSIVASVNGESINTKLAKETLEKALKSEKPKEGLILHSDQGCQYTSWEFVTYCREKKIIQSMSKAGCPYDNAPMERFYNTLKNELIYPNHFYTESVLDEALSRYVFVWYNHTRPHSYNDGRTPFEARTNR